MARPPRLAHVGQEGSNTGGRLRIAVGTLYGALERLERAGLVAAGAEEIVDGRARRYYRLTEEGTPAARGHRHRARL